MRERKECKLCYLEEFEGVVGHATLARQAETDLFAVGECSAIEDVHIRLRDGD